MIEQRRNGWSRHVWGAVAVVVATVTTVGAVADAEIEAGHRLCMEVGADPGDLAIVNLTPVNATASGYGVLTSSDVATPPTASNVNFAPATVDPNVAVAPIGSDGFVCFHNSNGGTVDLAADLLAVLSADMFTPNPTPDGAPIRIADTRIGLGGARVAPLERRCFASGATPGDLAVVNLTPVRATAPGYGVLTSSDTTTPPTASNVNFGPGTIDPNLAVTPIGADGGLCFHNGPDADLDLVADLLVTLHANTQKLPVPADNGPIRFVDTRIGLGGSRITPGEGRCWSTSATPGDLAIVNLTPVRATAPGNGVLTPSTLAGRGTSNVNYGPGTTDPNLTVTTVGENGNLCFLNGATAELDLVADILVVLRPGTHDNTGLPTRLIDTRPQRIDTITCPTATRCYAAGDRFYVSDDFGVTWEPSEYAVDLDQYDNDAIHCFTSDICKYSGIHWDGRASTGIQYVTLDGGRIWSDPGLSIVDDVSCPVVDTCLAVGRYVSSLSFLSRRGARVSNDGGRTWRSISLPPTDGSIDDRISVVTCSSSTECSAVSLVRPSPPDNPIATLLTFTSADGWETVSVSER